MSSEEGHSEFVEIRETMDQSTSSVSERNHNDSMSSSSTPSSRSPHVMTALLAGGLAGTSVDVALFPIDTLKTRLQSPQGFVAAGGFRGIYNGLGAAAIGSAPGAALFFSTYEVGSRVQNTFSISCRLSYDGLWN